MASGQSTYPGGAVGVSSGQHRHDERRDHDQDCECWCEGRERRTGVQLRHDELGLSGSISIGSGAATSHHGRQRRQWCRRADGDQSITVGSIATTVVQAVCTTVASGQSTVLGSGTGGAVGVSSGQGIATTSGAITIRTANAGAKGVSGVLVFSSGTTTARPGVRRLAARSRSARVRRHRHRHEAGVISITVGSGNSSGTSGAGGLSTVASGQQHGTHGRRCGCEQWSGHRHDERRDHDRTANAGAKGVSGVWCSAPARRARALAARSRSARVRRHRARRA